MELNFDWRGFQSMFYPRRKAVAPTSVGVHSPVYLIVDEGRIIAIHAEDEDYSEWIGATLEEMATQVTHREIAVYSRKEVDQWLQESITSQHSYEQTLQLRGKAIPQVVSKGWFKRDNKALNLKPRPDLVLEQNFLLDGILGVWSRLMPSSYGLFIRLEDDGGDPWEDSARELLVIVRRGRIDSFHNPDLTSMGTDRSKRPDDVVKYLSEKYLVKVYGIFTTTTEWKDWNDSAHSWRKMALALQSKRAKLVPFGPGLASLVASRAMISW